MTGTETRITRFPADLRQRDEGGPLSVYGYAAAFGKLSRGTDGFIEQLDPEAFAACRAAGWPGVTASFGGELLGAADASTLLLATDGTGLAYEADPDQGSAVIDLVRCGEIRHARWTFRVPPGGDERGDSEFGIPLRTLLSVQLVSIELVPITDLYPGAELSAAAWQRAATGGPVDMT